MTHDELLAKISQDWNGTPILYSAVRAVVELHTPYGSAGNELMCELCANVDGWPCTTIQVIEKELM